MCCGNDDKGEPIMDGSRYSVFYIHPNRGKKMVTGIKTKEKLGYIGYGSYIENVHEADISAAPGLFACGICQKQFSHSGDQSWCNTCYPKQTPTQPRLGNMQPRTYDQRLKATERFAQEQWSKPHPNFQGQPTPQQAQIPQAPRPQVPQLNPNAGFAQQQVRRSVMSDTAPLPPSNNAASNPKDIVRNARAQKEASFGIPVITPDIIGPPPNLTGNWEIGKTEYGTVVEAQPSRGVKNTQISDLDFGRAVNARHKQILTDNNILTLYDAGKLGVNGLENIKGIGAGVA